MKWIGSFRGRNWSEAIRPTTLIKIQRRWTKTDWFGQYICESIFYSIGSSCPIPEPKKPFMTQSDALVCRNRLGRNLCRMKSTICKFRHLMENHNQTSSFAWLMYLEENGLKSITRHDRGCQHHQRPQLHQEQRQSP